MNHSNQNTISPKFAVKLFEEMADGVFTLNEKGEITLWNPSMERITGYLHDEAIGKSCSLLNFDQCFGKSCPTGYSECGIFKYGAVDSKECVLRHKQGHDVHVLKSARLVKNGKGDVKGVVETVTDLTELHEARRKAEEATRRLGEKYKFHNLIGKSDSMQQVFSSIKMAAESEASILIQGESGTGKELVAGAIHYNSVRSDNPLITMNCSALSESLLESELFGHVKGSFTGAHRDRTGRFEEAEGGTIFLDEISEISPYIQVKLLRVLQEREIERVGESKKRKINIRIITATNKDLFTQVRKGNFRDDLYYRLKVFPIHIPPLRKRKKDIPILTSHFINIQNKKTNKKIHGITHQAMRILMDYSWPGNVRELENAIEHAFVLCNVDQLDIADLPIEIRHLEEYPDEISMPLPVKSEHSVSRKKLTREILIDLLDECGWNKAEVARSAGVSRTAIWKYMKKWDIPLKKKSL
ncbi:MAG: sigma 54-interacting transcriptional regulator [Deltaproteobacteria bacterium]|nr:sigma 54-interacting transcriptional regulator [Deltaproteobacteria bacterium]